MPPALISYALMIRHYDYAVDAAAICRYAAAPYAPMRCCYAIIIIAMIRLIDFAAMPGFMIFTLMMPNAAASFYAMLLLLFFFYADAPQMLFILHAMMPYYVVYRHF